MVFNYRCACNVAEFSDDQYVHQKEKEVSANGIEEFPVWRINNALQKYNGSGILYDTLGR